MEEKIKATEFVLLNVRIYVNEYKNVFYHDPTDENKLRYVYWRGIQTGLEQVLDLLRA